MYEHLLEGLGLAKNEAIIYETLLTEGESPVGHIATKSKVHRRNVYDTLQRLMEKGLVFEILQHKENRYQAVDPKKLSEVLQEKQSTLNKFLPSLEKLYQDKPTTEAVYIYRGLEGWKNYIRDILRIGEDDYIMGAKGVWADPKIKSFVEQFAKEAAQRDIKFHILIDESAKDMTIPVAASLKASTRIIPAKFYAASSFEIFGDHIVFLSDCSDGILRDDISITVVVNQKLADSFRAWFNFMWSASLPAKKG
jgi:sugar-specific transcriptional regulator TrmB